MSKPAFSMYDLQSGAKKLNTVEPPPADSKGSKGSSSGHDQAAVESLENLYDKHNGDLDAIFYELKADPSKAKKPHHRPKNAKEFAEKYLEGYYSIIDNEADNIAEAKSSHK
eukprot:CAMPEP_0170424412 /NCGR_PEP_ID=MMETSP0117_2-20130122/37541_1 /TAXON_ID=400756 /ORGANISM="Durinskia baltica, Strain CSIRO CS-38" /LENGTH=111 /DNA_ID=CAMNT_0010683273 /DNA_START=23 /DNA_END=358 /DNA_ORIENTATION=-